MKSIILKILVTLLKLLYLPMRLLKVKKQIVYISRQSNKESIDFKMIREKMEEKYPQYKNIVLTKKIEKGLLSRILYCGEVIKQMYYLATSKIIVLDTYCITVCVLPHKKETKVIQIWHALGAIKKFGYQTLETKWGTSEKVAKIMCMHKNYDYILAPSAYTANLFMQAFNANENQILYIGMPRIDYILSNNEKYKKQILEEYPILKDKETVLYVPTFRKGEKVELDELVEKIDTNKYNLIIKLHPLDLKEYKYKQKDGVIYDQKFKTYDLLKLSNKIITDYSSLSIETSLLNIPIYFYTYDIEKYKIETGINFNFEKEPIGYYNATNVDKLLDLMEEDYDYNRLKEFKEKLISVNTKNTTEQLVEFIERLIKNEKVKELGNKPVKKKQNI